MEEFKASKSSLFSNTGDRKTVLCERTIDGEQVLCFVNVGDIIDPTTGKVFNKVSYASERINLQKGGDNKFTITPRVLTENMNDKEDLIQTLGGSVTDVGQVFRMSSGIDNINKIILELEAIAGGAIQSIDDFESYADTTALRVDWIPSDVGNTPNTLETTIVAEGGKAMKIDILSANSKSRNDDFERVFASAQDWSTFDGIQLKYRRDNSDTIMELHIEDSAGDGSKATLTTTNVGVFELLTLNFVDFIPVGGVQADLTDIKKIKFVMKTAQGTPTYIDVIELFSGGAFGTVDLEVYDFGSESDPTSLGTPIKTITLNLKSGGKQFYDIPFDTTGIMITSNSFLGIVLTNPSVATVKVFGKLSDNKYTSGFAFDSADNGTNIAETATGDDLFFKVFSRDQAVFHGVRFVWDASTGNDSSLDAQINDTGTGKSRTSLFVGEFTLGRKEIEFPTRENTNVEIKMNKDELIEINYKDDGSQSNLATKLQATIYFTFIDRPLNG